jgi:hypothetical protein
MAPSSCAYFCLDFQKTHSVKHENSSEIPHVVASDLFGLGL